MEMVRVDDGTRLRTWTSGSGGSLPPVVLLHGGPGMWDYLEPVAEMLDPVTTVHRFDQRGCGGSDPSDEQTVARHLADLEALREHWGYDEWTVLGHSFGATLALAYAAAHPSRTSALGYLSGVGVGDWRTAYREERDRRMTPEQRHRLAWLKERVERTEAEELEFRVLSWFTDHADPVRGRQLAEEDARHEAALNLEANGLLNAETGAWTDEHLLGLARSLTMPAWFVHGACDPRPSRTVVALADAVPRAEVHLVEGAGHQPWRERPGEVRQLLRRLVTRPGG